MNGSPALKIAGLGMSWTEAYAISYARRLNEMGFCAKRYCAGNNYLVVYSFRPFTGEEVETALSDLMSD